ncbi:glycosyltransferase [Thalassospira tepidiphila]|uniref:Glycosyltransferase involved in cell wall biosynthesis n=1 Tax=Thalassospira tepidiphila TaxID=393657 RepID=A0ABX0X276_9PROT|nr:glycosyltransferase [Thalassospira tepidiphila]NJB75739.1 glycosyltransferase involved in cell wall biosynthesis [Thalassospira tepidiphila]
MQQTVSTRHWRDTMLGIAAILFGISAPLFFFGRAALGIGLGLSLICAVVSADHGEAWRKMRRDIATPIGGLVVAALIVFLISASFSVVPEKSLGTWLGRFAMVAGIWYLMRLIEPKAKLAWDACIYATWILVSYCLLAILVQPEVLSLKALREPDFDFDITRRLKPVGSFLIFGAMILVFDAVDRKNASRFFSLAIAVAIVPILEVSHGRANVAAMLAACGAIGFCAVFLIRSRLVQVAIAAAIGILVVIALSWLGDVTGNMSDLRGFEPYLPIWLVDVHRQMIWQFTFSHVFDHPLIGYGINAAPWVPGANELAGSSTQSVLPGHPHSWFMEIWLEAGALGLAVVVPLVLMIGLTGFKDVRHNGIVKGGLTLMMMASYWFAGLFNYSFWTSWWFGVVMLTFTLAFLRRERLLVKDATVKRRKTLIVCAEDWSFVSHRIVLGRAALVRGDDVVVACNTAAATEGLRKEGFRLVHVPIARGGLSPLKSLKTITALACLIRRENPDVIVNVAIQCVVLSSFAGILVGAKRSVNMVTGLGFLFVSDGAKTKILRQIVSLLLRFYALCPSIRVIVQNADDYALMKRLGYKERCLALIRGSGVDISAFSPAGEKTSEPKSAIFVARMLWSKGLGELIEAARILKSRKRDYRLVLVGDVDPANPDSASKQDLQSWQSEGLVEWLGKRSDIGKLLRESDLAVLPSWREGLPKSLLEAAASGLAMVATDVPGCREIVRHGENGVLVPLRDSTALAGAIEELMEDDTRRKAYGKAARELVERDLCDSVIIAQTLAFVTGDEATEANHSAKATATA